MISDYKIDKIDLYEALYETNESLPNRDLFYMNCVYERVEKCTSSYFSDFDEELESILDSIESRNFETRSVKKLMRLSRKVMSDTYDKYIGLLEKYIKE